MLLLKSLMQERYDIAVRCIRVLYKKDRAIQLHREAEVLFLFKKKEAFQCYYQAARLYEKEGNVRAAQGLYQQIIATKGFHAPSSIALLILLKQEEELFFRHIDFLAREHTEKRLSSDEFVSMCTMLFHRRDEEESGVTCDMLIAYLAQHKPYCSRLLRSTRGSKKELKLNTEL